MARLLAQMFNTAFHPRAVACHARRLMVAVVACLALASCAVNPATGERNLMLLSESQEAAMGAQEHPKLVKAFGGTYDDPAITAYVNEIGQKLVSVSEYADRKFTFTVVDSPIVNAFALPGGYVYVTRGLLALAQDEAELAGVLAHEIGHVTARHSAQRVSQSVLATLGIGRVAGRNRQPGSRRRRPAWRRGLPSKLFARTGISGRHAGRTVPEPGRL